MFSKRLLTRAGTSASLKPSTRSFSTTQWQQRAPALSDIEPNKEQIFDTKQREFREGLARKAKERRDQERNAALKTNAESSDTSNLSGEGLGSLSIGEQARKNDEASKRKQPSGRFSSLIYGTEEGREMDRDIERSFSQVLARGKYVHSIVFHEVKPDKVDEYVDLVAGWYPRVASNPDNKVHLVGSWRTEVGDCDTFGM